MTVKEIIKLLPKGSEWDNYIISPTILKDPRGKCAYEAGFKDCLIEIRKRLRKSNTSV
jgi:hypothetical protein